MHRGAPLLPWLCAIALVLWLTIEWWSGFGEHGFDTSRAQPVGQASFQLSIPAIATLGWLAIDDLRVELLEDGRPLGPRVDELSQIEELGGRGSFCLQPVERELFSSHHSLKQFLGFSALDSEDVRSNGRTYALRWYRRGDPNALLVVVASWLGLLTLATRRLRARPSPDPPAAAAWPVVLAFAGFTVAALFGARLDLAASWPWFCLIFGSALPALWWIRPVRPAGDWLTWLLALLGLAAATTVVGSLFASTVVLRELMVGVVVGWIGFLALRQRVEAVGRQRQTVARALAWACVLMALVLFLRQAGFRFADLFSRDYPFVTSDSWQDKFSENWLLVLFWAAMAAAPPRSLSWKRKLAAVSFLIVFALLVSSTLTLKIASVLSAAAFILASWRPGAARRSLVALTLVSVLGAPWFAATAWNVSLANHDPTMAKADRLRLARRAGIWEYTRRLIWRHPLIGEGLGASNHLPGKYIPLADLIPVPRDTLAAARAARPALAGGHPHNFALQVWLELGPAGALLAAGLMVAALGSARRSQRERAVHAARLALYVAITTFLFANYPLWSPVIVCLVFFSAGVASILRTDRQPKDGRSRRLWWLAPWSLLALAVLVMGMERSQRWRQVQLYRHSNISLPARGDSVFIDGREQKLTGRAIGELEVLPGEEPDSLRIRGWAVDRSRAEAVDHVIAFHGELPLAVFWTGEATPELHRTTSKEDLSTLFAGFEITVGCQQPCHAEAFRVVLFTRDGQPSMAMSPDEAEDSGRWL